MEHFIKPFIEKGVIYSIENFLSSTEDNTEINYIKVLHKVIFKHDVVAEFKQILNLVCSPEPFTVKNEMVNEIIKQLFIVSNSDDDVKEKIDVFSHVFQSFTSACKGNDSVHAVQFFLVLSHIVGMNSLLDNSKKNEIGECNIISAEHFNSAFSVSVSNPSSAAFPIFKELLLQLSKESINFNSTELQVYTKWLQQLIKNIAYTVPFQNIFLEIFSIYTDIDVKLLEGNIDHIFCNILSQKPPVDEEFCNLYSIFFERALKVCSQFQRTIKFITKFLSNIKTVSTLLSREIILPLNVLKEFSKIVTGASNQQSISLFDVLLQNLNECVSVIVENNSGFNTTLLFTTSDLLVTFCKEVKLFAPSISKKTLQELIDKLNVFKETLHQFGTFLFSDMSFILNNEEIVKTFLELCIYCGESEMLINCYKDSLLEPSELMKADPATECDWHCYVNLQQWKKLINYVLKAKHEILSPICFQLALQKCRHYKLQNLSDVDDSTLKIIMFQLTSGARNFNIFQQLPPEDFTILMEILSVKQCSSVCKKILKQLLENDLKTESVIWLCNPELQECSTFVAILFSRVIKEIAVVLRNSIPEKKYTKVSWLSDDYFDEYYNVLGDKVNNMADNVTYLFKNGEKVRKYVNKSSERQILSRVVEVLKLLPLAWMRGDCCRLGLCYAFVMAVFLSDDENSVRSPLEWILSFLSSDVDVSTCCQLGYCVQWLSELSYEDNRVNEVKVKLMEGLVRNCPNMKFGLKQMGEVIEEAEMADEEKDMKILDSRVILYNELGKCWQRSKKRKSDNDLIGSYRTKLAKIISETAKQLPDSEIHTGNSTTLLRIFAIELLRAIKANDENEISILMEQKLSSYSEFAMNKLKKEFDEASAMFLTVTLQSTSHIRKFLPENFFFQSWKVLRFYGKVNWKLFCTHSTEEEFDQILKGLHKMSKKFLNPEAEEKYSNCFEIWISFFETSLYSKKSNCQQRLQEFFYEVHNYSLLLENLPIRKKISLVKFFLFCVSKKEVILTSHIMDTIIFTMLECLNDESSSVEDFASLFVTEVETSSAIFLKHFDWSRSKIHLTFLLFRDMLASLMKRCGTHLPTQSEEVFKLSTCAFSLEKWAGLLIKKEKDFARTAPYFIAALVSSLASVNVIPAIKIHLTNCVNHFLSISDSHTVSYLLRVLKPGYQQVFNSMYNQFKKYHKYSGKI